MAAYNSAPKVGPEVRGKNCKNGSNIKTGVPRPPKRYVIVIGQPSIEITTLKSVSDPPHDNQDVPPL